MHIVRHPSSCPADAQGAVIALGNFDGVHRGHAAVIRTACDIAQSIDAPSAVMTFTPHPIRVLRPESAPPRITLFREKAERLQQLGISVLYALHFTKAFSEIPATDFIETILVNQLKAKHIVIGYDYIFGHNRSGNAALLHEYAEKYGFGFTHVDAVTEHSDTISSTTIRRLIQNGRLEEANSLLGHDFTLSGRVIHGNKRGRELGFPTANILMKNRLLPPFGVYAATVCTTDITDPLPAVVNIGIRPSIDNPTPDPLLEAHILEGSPNLYGKRLYITPRKFIRPETKFPNLETLRQQIEHDKNKAGNILETPC